MIPSVLAGQIRETLLDYLRTTFALSDPGFERIALMSRWGFGIRRRAISIYGDPRS